MNTPPHPDDGSPPPVERPLFAHPQWTVGIVLVLAVVALMAGFRNPVWWLIGSPLILVLLLYLWVRLFTR